MSQHKYIHDLLHKFNIQDCNTGPTPQAKSAVLEKKTKTVMTLDQIAAQPFDYRGLVGSLMYLVCFFRGTSLDIS